MQDSYSSKFKSKILSHVKSVHQGIRKFNCELCSYSAKEKSKIAVHVKSVHQGVRYPCEYEECSYSSKSESALRSHVKYEHEGGIKFSCDHFTN